jgi:hypothetical protein
MNELNNNINGYSDADKFMNEFDAANKKGQSEYRKMLRKLCPSKEMRKKAKSISNQKYPCEKCAYFDKETLKCKNPHENIYNIFIDVDHCYEGILRYLVKQTEEAKERALKTNNKLYDEALEVLDTSFNIIVKEMKITRRFARWIIMMADGNWKIPRGTVKVVREKLDRLNDILPPSDDETAEADGE